MRGDRIQQTFSPVVCRKPCPRGQHKNQALTFPFRPFLRNWGGWGGMVPDVWLKSRAGEGGTRESWGWGPHQGAGKERREGGHRRQPGSGKKRRPKHASSSHPTKSSILGTFPGGKTANARPGDSRSRQLCTKAQRSAPKWQAPADGRTVPGAANAAPPSSSSSSAPRPRV